MEASDRVISEETKKAMARLEEISAEILTLSSAIPDNRIQTRIRTAGARIREALDNYERHLKKPPKEFSPHPDPRCIQHGEPRDSCSRCAAGDPAGLTPPEPVS